MIPYLFARLAEASTWRGMAVLLTAAGVYLSPEQVEAIISIGLALVGIIGVFFPDKVQADL
jgi:multidrug transporter EmrE-like cation transporter